MKKLIAALLLVLMGASTCITADAQTKKQVRTTTTRKAAARKTGPKLVGTVCDLKLYSDYTIKGPRKKGTYKDFGGYYTFEWSSNRTDVDIWHDGVIVGDYLYNLDSGGTDGCVEYKYKHDEKLVYYVDNCEESKWTEPLEKCDAHKITWIGKPGK